MLLVAGVFAAWRRTRASPASAARGRGRAALGAALWMGLTSVAASRGLIRFDPISVVRAWNWIATLLLLNIIVISWLSTPTPLRVFDTVAENVWIASSPFIRLPTVVVAFAILGHVVIFRRLRAEGSR